MPVTRTLSLLTAGLLAAACLSSALPAAAAHAETLSPDTIKNLAAAEGKAQAAAQEYSLPIQKPKWKILFLGMTDETWTDGSRHVMTADDRIYAQTVVDDFEATIESNGMVDIVPTLTFDSTPVLPGESALHEVDIVEPLKRAAGLAEFDSIMVFSKDGGHAITAPGFYNDQSAQGSAYSFFPLHIPNSPKYPGKTEIHENTTSWAMHEFGHQVSHAGWGFSYPDLHAGGDVQYDCGDGEAWCYYLDYLSGKVAVKGINKGTYPKMWPFSPRFVHRPAVVTVHYEDESGRTLAPDANVYGPGGDAYDVPAMDIDGYSKPVLKKNSASSQGTFVTGTRAEVTYVYSVPVTVLADGGTTDLRHSLNTTPGDLPTWVYGYRATAPLTAFTYTDRLDPNDGAKRLDRFGGTPVNWNASGTATLAMDGNTYTLERKSDTLVEITVELGTPTTEFRLFTMEYTNEAATARMTRTLEVTSATPASTNRKEMLSNTPRAIWTITWGDYKAPVSFSDGGTTDFRHSLNTTPGDLPTWVYGYRATAPLTAFTYTDRLDPNDGAKRLDRFGGTPVNWNASGTATLAMDGNTYTLERKSDTLVEITVELGTPTTEFRLFTMEYTNEAATARMTRTLEVTSATPASTNTKVTLSNTPRAIWTITWGDYK